ncbi:MAG TPA: hypothetical protein PLL17_00460 [Defluviitaleaceae bacterium]|jgi:hypothetical protein|nr:hypothetical protein [Candidatus Epulonipiscium sp.]HOQ17004.1 hypothetical protein [Defluviitaleaceae bacterium]HPT77210.1 hypothetical protein [Defluviitaleaceae bacterium]HQD49592.1 hypothetical protein [Defluviitaleaceae bacterium]
MNYKKSIIINDKEKIDYSECKTGNKLIITRDVSHDIIPSSNPIKYEFINEVVRNLITDWDLTLYHWVNDKVGDLEDELESKKDEAVDEDDKLDDEICDLEEWLEEIDGCFLGGKLRMLDE